MKTTRTISTGIALSCLAILLSFAFSACSSTRKASTKEDVLLVKRLKVDASTLEAKDVPALMDKYKVSSQPIACVNWPEESDYCPEVTFRIAHTGDAILLDYKIKEETVRAVAENDNGQVWKDACVEFFISPTSDDYYYNIENSCAARVLLMYGKVRTRRPAAPRETVALIKRWSSLGTELIKEPIYGGVEWEYAAIIPKEALYKSDIDTFTGKTMTGNFFKCGDDLPTPHFLTWKPIHLEQRQFHSPEFFGKIRFE